MKLISNYVRVVFMIVCGESFSILPKKVNKVPSPLTTDKTLISSSSSSSSSSQVKAWPANRDPKGVAPDYPLATARIGFTITATILTWYAHASNKAGPVLASSAVTLLSSLTAPGLGQAAMTGTFAGMCGIGLISNWKYALALGILTSFLFEFCIHYWNVFLGLGGRLGLTAFIGVNGIALSRGIIPCKIGVFDKSVLASLNVYKLLEAMMYGAIGSVATIALREASDDKAAADPVRASALVGVLAALLVGVGGFTNFGALLVYGGSFTGMSLPSRLIYGKNPKANKDTSATINAKPIRLLSAFALAGALGGLVHQLTVETNLWGLADIVKGGWGGKAGACSFLGVVIFRVIAKLVEK